MRKASIVRAASAALAVLAAGCSGGGGDKADADVIVGVVSGPVTEGGEQASFTVVLRAKPSKDVTIPVVSADENEGTVSPASLTFTKANWDAPQTVLVTGVDDAIRDGNKAFTIELGAATSGDKVYSGFDADDVLVTNLDDETAGVRTTAVTGQTTELGNDVTFDVVLQSRPTADVLLIFGTSDLGEGTTGALQQMTFTTDTWNTPQTVTVTGVDDNEADGPQNYQIIFSSAFSEDPDYAFLPVAAVPVTNLDDDSAGIFVSKNSGVTSEQLAEQSFSVRLLSRPSATVSVTWTLSNTAEASFASTTASTLVQQFTINNWMTPQTFIVRGDDDTLADGDKTYNVSVTTIASTDSTYTALVKPRIDLVNVDDDIPGFIVTVPTGPTSESGDSATFKVSLRAAATAQVSVNIASSLPGEATVTPSTLNLTTTPATITVKGKLDFKRDGHKPYGITFTPAVSTDMAYNGRQIPNVGLTNIDDGPVRSVLVFDDAHGSEADDAADAAGFTVLQASTATAFDALFDAGGLDFIILELSSSSLPVSSESRLTSWVTSGGSLIISHWDLASHSTLESAFEVSATPFTSNNRLFLPATASNANLFGAPNAFPAPLIGDALMGDVANELMVTTTAGQLACRFDDPNAGPGAIAITRGGAVVVNGFSPDDIGAVDAEQPTPDGIPDVRELYLNEIAGLSTPGGGGGPATGRFDNNTALPIPDNSPAVASDIVVTATGTVNRVRISLRINHTWIEDVDVQLRSPSGTIIDVTSDNGGSGDFYGSGCADAQRTTFDDLATTSITAGTAPFVGSFQPEQTLSTFSGQSATGTWSLLVADDEGAITGPLECWSIFFE